MPDLRDRFALADEIEPRDLWTEARRRADAPATSASSLSWAPGPRKRLTAGVVAFAVFVGASVFAWELSHVDGPPPDGSGSVDPWASLPVGWSELPPPPEVRTGTATVWTGSQMLVWGGYEYTGYSDESSQDDGFAYDASSRTWSPIAVGPLDGRSDPAFAWTGDQLLIWGGRFEGGESTPSFFADGAAYDPSAGTWRSLPEAPIDGRAPFSVWTGSELVVWGSTDRTARRLDGAAYDPAADRWRPIAEGPVDITDGSAVWSGDEMLVVGAALDGNNHAETRTVIGGAYDPEADVWRELPASGLSPQAMTAAWLNGELVAWDYDLASEAYDPGVDRWRSMPRVPLEFSECRPQSASTSRIVLGDFCGKTVVFTAEEQTWRRAPLPPSPRGCCWPNELVAAGDVVLAMSHAIATQSLDAVARRMYVYNPPVASPDPPIAVAEPDPFVPPTETVDGVIRMPIVFPDGSTGTLVYPTSLDLASLGIQPDVVSVFDGRYQGRIVFLHDPGASIARYVEGREPVTAVPSSDGEVEVWSAREVPDHEAEAWLAYRLTSWTVLVPLGEQGLAERVASSLHVLETTGGFPVIDTFGDADLAEGFGEAGGPELTFGDESPDPFMVSQLDALLILSPDGCDPATVEPYSGGYGSICLGNGAVFGSIYGGREFGVGVTEGLVIEDFHRA